MPQNFLRNKVDQLIEIAVQIYHVLEGFEENLLKEKSQELNDPVMVKSNPYVRKRILRYMVYDMDNHSFQTLWLSYQVLFRELYRDFRKKNASPTEDEVFASREIFEDALKEVNDTTTFKHVFLQKAYDCFGVDFIPVQNISLDISLFQSLDIDDSDDSNSVLKDFDELEASDSQVCQIM